MLNAARLAGAMTTADVVEGLADASGTVTSTFDASADQSSPEVGHDPKPTDEKNKFAAKDSRAGERMPRKGRVMSRAAEMTREPSETHKLGTECRGRTGANDCIVSRWWT
jgi:hypothetical protein